MKTSMLEYVKMILKKVSFDKSLVRKEYKKSLNWLTKSEANELREWVRNNRTDIVTRTQRQEGVLRNFY